MNNDDYEDIFGKGILLFVGLSAVFFLCIGGVSQSWMNLDVFRGDYLLVLTMFYSMHFKFVFESNPNVNFNNLNRIIVYAILNSLLAMGFNMQYFIIFSIFQAILINGYTGSIFYKGVSQIKWKVYEDSIDLINKRKNSN